MKLEEHTCLKRHCKDIVFCLMLCNLGAISMQKSYLGPMFDK